MPLSSCQRLMNVLGLVKRLSRFIYGNSVIERSNSHTFNRSDRPQTILSWNIDALFLNVYPGKTEELIKELLYADADIICLQECFDEGVRDSLIHGLYKVWPYYLVGSQTKRYFFGEGSGLLVLCKHKVCFAKEVVLTNYNIPDRWANKTILYFSCGNINVCTTHLQSNNMCDNTGIVRDQLHDILDKSPFERFIVAGDLNHVDAHYLLGQVKNNYNATYKYKHEILDYILPINYDNYSMVTHVQRVSCSDHNPIIYKCNIYET